MKNVRSKNQNINLERRKKKKRAAIWVYIPKPSVTLQQTGTYHILLQD